MFQSFTHSSFSFFLLGWGRSKGSMLPQLLICHPTSLVKSTLLIMFTNLLIDNFKKRTYLVRNLSNYTNQRCQFNILCWTLPKWWLSPIHLTYFNSLLYYRPKKKKLFCFLKNKLTLDSRRWGKGREVGGVFCNSTHLEQLVNMAR